MENTEQQKKDEQFMRRALVEAEAAWKARVRILNYILMNMTSLTLK